MKFVTKAQEERDARAWRILRDEVRKARTHSVQLATELTSARQHADAQRDRADKAEDTMAGVMSQIAAAHRQMLAERNRLERECARLERICARTRVSLIKESK